MNCTAKIYVVENSEERYSQKFWFESQARAAMRKHSVDTCKILYLSNGKWSHIGDMSLDGYKNIYKQYRMH